MAGLSQSYPAPRSTSHHKTCYMREMRPKTTVQDPPEALTPQLHHPSSSNQTQRENKRRSHERLAAKVSLWRRQSNTS